MQCILRIPNAITMAIRALGVVLLFSLVGTLLGLPTSVPDSTVNTHEEHTLSTELRPPLLEKEHHATVYIINLYAVKNSSGITSGEVFENDIVEAVPDILEPLATVLLVVEDDEDEENEKHSPVDLDEFAEGLEGQGFKVGKIDLDSKTRVLKMKLEKAEAQDMIESASQPAEEKKDRKKRTICLKCGKGGYGGGGYGGGGYGRGGYGGYGGGYPSGGGYCPTCGGGGYNPGGGGGGYYPPSGGGGYQKAVVPVVVVPITGGGHHHHGGGGGGYPRGGYYPSGGCNNCGGGGGGGGSFSQASASAQASSGSWGKK